MQEKLHEECGVFGIYDNDNLDVVTSAYLALYALQHRGQESCGIAVNDDGVIRSYRDLGLVTDVFNPPCERPDGHCQQRRGSQRL